MTNTEKLVLTTLGRLLLLLIRNNGKASFAEARKYVGSAIYTAVIKGTTNGLIIMHDDRSLELTPEGRALAECLAKCF